MSSNSKECAEIKHRFRGSQSAKSARRGRQFDMKKDDDATAVSKSVDELRISICTACIKSMYGLVDKDGAPVPLTPDVLRTMFIQKPQWLDTVWNKVEAEENFTEA